MREISGNASSVPAALRQLLRCALLASLLTLSPVAFAAEVGPPAATSESTSKAPSAEQSTAPAPQTPAQDKVKDERVIRPVSLITAGLLGFFLSLVYLLTKLSRFWGLRVLRNGWSIGFLVSGTVFSVLSSPFFSKLMGSHGIVQSVASLESLGDLGSSLGASVVGSGFVSVVQRLFGKSRSAGGDQPKDITKSNAKGFLFDRIGESLAAQINLEIGRLSEKLDWISIDTLTTKVIFAAQTADRITTDEGDKVLKEIEQFKKATAADQREENLNKYKALNRALSCVSFKALWREHRNM